MNDVSKPGPIDLPSREPLPEAPARAAKAAVVAVLLTALGAQQICEYIIVLLAPLIRLDLGLNEAQIGIAAAAMTAGIAIALLPMGAVIDRVKPHLILTTIVGSLGLMLLGLGQQTTFSGFVVWSFLVGVAKSGIMLTINNIIFITYASAQRGKIVGLIYSGVPLAGFIGASALPALGEAVGWRAVVCLLGVATLTCGLVSYALVRTGKAVRKEQGLRSPLPPNERKAFVTLVVTYGLYAGSLSCITFVVLFLVDIVKTSVTIAGVCFAIFSISAVGGRLFWGFLADRRPAQKRWWLLSSTVWVAVAAFTLLSTLGSGSAPLAIVFTMVVLGMGAESSWGLLSTVLLDVAGSWSPARATALMSLAVFTTKGLGTVAFGSLVEQGVSYSVAFRLFGGLAAVAAIAFTWAAISRNKQAIS